MVHIIHGSAHIWLRAFRRGIGHAVRERDWLTSLAAMTGMFLLLQFSILGFHAVNGGESLLRAQTDLHLEIQSSAQESQIQAFVTTIQGLSSVESVVYITSEQAYARMREQDPDLIAFVEEYGLENPFPETLSITLRTLDAYEEFVSFLQESRWTDIIHPTFLSQTSQQESGIRELLQLTRAGRLIALFFMLLTGSILMFLTIELVRGRVARRAEIVLIEHLSGTLPSVILQPFVAEAIVLLFIALISSVLISIILLITIGGSLPALAEQGLLGQLQDHIGMSLRARLSTIIIVEIAAVLCIGWLGAWLGTVKKRNPRGIVLHKH